jgi:hypothetical protein
LALLFAPVPNTPPRQHRIRSRNSHHPSTMDPSNFSQSPAQGSAKLAAGQKFPAFDLPLVAEGAGK